MKRIALALVLFAAFFAVAQTPRRPARRATPVENNSTVTQSVNETAADTARINAARRARSTHYHRDDGFTVYIDTITGDEWVDSTVMPSVPPMKYPLLDGLTLGVNVWDPAMRLFGQKYGLIGFSADISLHNRYFPVVEVGLGQAKNTPAGKNFTFRSPLSVWFKLGMDYNFLYNSNPDYQWFAGVRYGFAPFSWSVDDISLNSGYWDQTSRFSIPSQNYTAGWGELLIGLRVRLFGNISAGWAFRFHTILHESKNPHGKPWYIPGYGSRKGAITGSFTISYTLPIGRKHRPFPPSESSENSEISENSETSQSSQKSHPAPEDLP